MEDKCASRVLQDRVVDLQLTFRMQTALYLPAFELCMLLTFSLCLIHAIKTGVGTVLQLMAGIAFGLLLELATIRQLNAYRYGAFTVMVFDVPLVIGVAWGCLIYSVHTFTRALSVPEWARPVIDALLVLTVDLSMDAIAIRLGMWDWGKGLQFQYFGVPWANFWAWSWVVFSFSAGLRLLSYRPGWMSTWLAPLGAMVIGVLGVMASNELITNWVPRVLYESTVAGLFIMMIGLVIVLRPRLAHAPDPLAGQVALIQHTFFLTAGLV